MGRVKLPDFTLTRELVMKRLGEPLSRVNFSYSRVYVRTRGERGQFAAIGWMVDYQAEGFVSGSVIITDDEYIEMANIIAARE